MNVQANQMATKKDETFRGSMLCKETAGENVLSAVKVSERLPKLGISCLPAPIYGKSGGGITMLARYKTLQKCLTMRDRLHASCALMK